MYSADPAAADYLGRVGLEVPGYHTTYTTAAAALSKGTVLEQTLMVSTGQPEACCARCSKYLFDLRSGTSSCRSKSKGAHSPLLHYAPANGSDLYIVE